jgi:hypothetical protein
VQGGKRQLDVGRRQLAIGEGRDVFADFFIRIHQLSITSV